MIDVFFFLRMKMQNVEGRIYNLLRINILDISECIVFEALVMHCYRYAKEVCDAVVAKCLTGRPKTVEKAQMVFMLWVELEAVDVFLVCFV